MRVPSKEKGPNRLPQSIGQRGRVRAVSTWLSWSCRNKASGGCNQEEVGGVFPHTTNGQLTAGGAYSVPSIAWCGQRSRVPEPWPKMEKGGAVPESAVGDDHWPRSEHDPLAGRRTLCRPARYCPAGHGFAHGHQVSTQGRFLPVRGGGGGQARRPSTIQRRVSAGSMTSSISNRDAVLIALPCSYMPATRSS